MQRRDFLSVSMAAGLGLTANVQAQAKVESGTTDVSDLPLFYGHPVVSGPAPESIAIIQAVNHPATGYVEIAVGDEPFKRIDAETAGLLPFEQHVLKFNLPPLPPGKSIRYRVVARSIEFKTAYKILSGDPVSTEVRTFRTLDPNAAESRFAVWNDTHENLETIKLLQERTSTFKPDFLLWNGDQTNDVYDPVKMRSQYVSPGELEICSQWPMAYARGNHDVRGPSARLVSKYTGTPNDRFYYAFRSGPAAVLVMDTGEDKPDSREAFAGLAGFEYMRQRQREWLAAIIQEEWFKSAPYRVLFCHIPLWWQPDEKVRDFWMCSEVCRDAWLPLLQEAGVQLIVSGHIHRTQNLPKSAEQPIHQVTGGGPRREIATIMEGVATQESFKLTCKTLTGDVVYEVVIPGKKG